MLLISLLLSSPLMNTVVAKKVMFDRTNQVELFVIEKAHVDTLPQMSLVHAWYIGIMSPQVEFLCTFIIKPFAWSI